MSRDIDLLFEKMIGGDRIALAQAMTLTESDRPMDRSDAISILQRCEEKLQSGDPSVRLAISGAPGAGKSTFIEAIGMQAIQAGYQVGVLSIDPTSTLSRGSILGDKSRMALLSTSPNAFIRPSAAGDVLGGLGRRSMEMMTLLAAAGYNLIFLETVGVGQSEHTTWQFTDGFILLIQPGAGDELQGIKRGITELADIVVVNKADQHLINLARIAKGQYQNALHFFTSSRDGWNPKILTCSALEGNGIDDVWETIRLYMEYLERKPSRTEDRIAQKLKWLNWSLRLAAQQILMQQPEIQQKIESGHEKIKHQPASIFSIEYEIEMLMQALLHSESTTKPT